MKVTFIGAAHEVTGSCTLLEAGGAKFLIDCGMEQGQNVYKNISLPVAESEIDAVFLTHAHIDHSGSLPLLYKRGFRGTVYATNETCSLCDIMLRDSAHIQMSEAEYKTRKSNRAGGGDIAPVYDLEDAAGLLRLMRRCDYAKKIPVTESVAIRFTDIGHLLGSACVEIWLREGDIEKKIVFSGDVGNVNQPIINDPKQVAETDYLVIEATYGDRLHPPRADHVGALADHIQRTLDRGGNVVIPAFAVGRTQEMLYFIREIKNSGLVKGHDGFQVYVDSPLANEATSIFMQCDVNCMDPETRALMAAGQNPLVFDGLKTYVSVEESKLLNQDKTPKVIISASGMADAGRIRHHLKHNLWRPECLILFVGYQANGTLGRAIAEGAKSVRLFGDEIAVNAEVAMLPGVSGHADKQGLLNWVEGYTKKPGLIFVNHGDDDAIAEFVRTLTEERGLSAYSPHSGTEYDLAKGEFIRITDGVPAPKKQDTGVGKAAPRRAAPSFTQLVAAAERLLDIARGSEGMANRELTKFADQINELTRRWKR